LFLAVASLNGGLVNVIRRASFAAILALGTCGGLVSPAQAPATTPDASVPANSQEPADPQLKINPVAALRAFEPAANEEYRLGSGDELQIDFAGRPELQAKTVVGPDGRISLPLVGSVALAGETRAEAATTVDTDLAAYYPNLSATVTVVKYTSNRILLLGAVEHPGVLYFDSTPTLLEVITRGGLLAGGITKTPMVPEQCAIYRGDSQVMWVQLKQLLDTGNSLADMRLRRDDIVFIPNEQERFISVLGQVEHPGAVPLTSSSSIASILAQAGGLNAKAGGNPKIQLIDPATGKTRVVSFKDVLNPAKASELRLTAGSILYVPESGFSKVGVVLEKLSPVTSLATMTMLAVHP
jgi:polysaccharide export outer membrane protein